MSVRFVSSFFNRWKYLIFSCCVTYLLVFYVVNPAQRWEDDGRREVLPKHIATHRIQPEVKPKTERPNRPSVKFNPVGVEPFQVEELLTDFPVKLKERLTCKVKEGEKRIILSWNAGHSQDNLGGCKDWNCEFTTNKNKLSEAHAVLMSGHDPKLTRQSPNQYFIHFSQESPKNSFAASPYPGYYNMTIGFRHDSATASPYGYTVKLGEKSFLKGDIVDKELIKKKTKGAAWFVSHCSTNSKREVFIRKFQEHYPVDIYGGCGTMKCPRNGQCESVLDKDYDFYIAFENSICKDYNTEKLWKHGYTHTVIPIVMKRSIAEPFSPPHSFIAIDDFKTLKDMADHLNYLRQNRTAYMEYFEWRREYKVIFLDGSHHDVLERPWGFCQVCRLIWEEPKPSYAINDWQQFWTNSCEKDGELVDKILANSK